MKRKTQSSGPRETAPSRGAPVAGKRSRWAGGLFFFVAAGFLLVYAIWFLSHNHPSGLVGKPAPDFAAYTAEKKEVALSSFFGTRILLVFWMDRGAQARDELRYLAEQYSDLQQRGIEVVAVNLDLSLDQAASVSTSLNLPYASLFDPSRTSASRYSPVVVPATYFIDEKGVVVEFLAGFHDFLKQDIAKWKP
ncbi:MAG: peroxiredoxin family protein [bacterium]